MKATGTFTNESLESCITRPAGAYVDDLGNKVPVGRACVYSREWTGEVPNNEKVFGFPESSPDPEETRESNTMFNTVFDPIKATPINNKDFNDPNHRQRLNQVLNVYLNMVARTSMHEAGHGLGLDHPNMETNFLIDSGLYTDWADYSSTLKPLWVEHRIKLEGVLPTPNTNDFN